MRRPAVVIMTAFFSLSSPSTGSALDIWHSGNGFAQGVCSYEFTLDGQREQFESIEGISRLVIGLHGYRADDPDTPFTEELDIGAFADSEATRHARTYWEGECGINQFVIYQALAVIDGKPHDLLHENALHVVDSPLKDAANIKVQN